MTQVLIIGASGGIGAALTRHLCARGALVTTLSRSADGLDVTDQACVDAQLGALTGAFDLMLVATGALVVNGSEPERRVKDITARAMADQFAVNCIGPSLVMRHAAHLLPRDRRAVFAALSARVGSIGDNALGGWYSYRTAKAALNQMIRTAAIELRRSHQQAICVALHPGTVATPFTAKYAGRHKTVPAEDAAASLLRVLDGLTQDNTGRFYDWAGREVPW